jgi:acetyl esterase/lipase
MARVAAGFDIDSKDLLTMHSQTIFVALMLIAFSPGRSITAEDQQAANGTGEKYRTVADISYRDGEGVTEYMRERCRLDLYYPTAVKEFPTVIWFHGGGLKGGNRSVPTTLKEKGLAVVAVNYRLSPRVKSPAHVEDAAAAVAWAFRNIEKYGGSSSRIFVSGHSAGGYLTSMVGLDKRWLAANQLDADQIAGLIPFSGHTITHFTVRAERGIGEKQPVIDDLAPLFHVRKDAPPLLLITGDRELEMLGRYEENAYLWRMMQVVGHPDTELFELDGFNHGQMAEPAHLLLIRFVNRISSQK